VGLVGKNPGRNQYPLKPLLDIRRLDLVWNIYCDPKEMLLLLRNARWPKVRKGPEQYLEFDSERIRRTGVRFAGKEVTLQFYDKKSEIMRKSSNGKGPSHCLRVEAQFKSKNQIRRVSEDHTIHEDLRDGDMRAIRLDGWAFCRLYMILRDLVLLLDPPELCIPKKLDYDSLLAMAEHYHNVVCMHGLEADVPWGASPMELLQTQSLKPETIQKRLRRARSIEMAKTGFSLGSLLPELAPPFGVDVYPDGREVAVPTLWFPVPDDCPLPRTVGECHSSNTPHIQHDSCSLYLHHPSHAVCLLSQYPIIKSI